MFDKQLLFQELYLSVLSSTSTSREARSYLQRFRPSLAAACPETQAQVSVAADAPPLLHPPAILKYLKQSSFTQADIKARNQTYVQRLLRNHPPPALSQLPLSAGTSFFIPEIAEEDIHVGLVKIRDVSKIDDATLHGIGRTLSQLNRLGLFSVVIVDEAPPPGTHHHRHPDTWRELLRAQADRVVSAIEDERGRARRVDGCVTVTHAASAPEITLPNLLVAPLSRGVIPVLVPIALNSTQRAVPTTADELVLSLTALLSAHSPPHESATTPVEQPVSLDRIIFLDPLGGIPSHDRPSGAHVFINMEQEYASLRTQLSEDSCSTAPHSSPHHLANLNTLRSALSLLPPTSSAIITTPSLAAAYANPAPQTTLTAPPVKAKNPLIHNLLTDKPLISSSLPVHSSYQGTLTTLLKHGIPLRIFSPSPSDNNITALTHSSIDLPKLAALIENSFAKKLDLAHYLQRTEHNLAALIVAGDYEGAAIVTWERPRTAGPRVCYLDKFAVLKRSQGAGGVADVVFKSMVDGVRRGLFPGAEGVVWRSRRWNPVNKWVCVFSSFPPSFFLPFLPSFRPCG